MGRLRFELRTNRLKAECSTAELATLWMGPRVGRVERITWRSGRSRGPWHHWTARQDNGDGWGT